MVVSACVLPEVEPVERIDGQFVAGTGASHASDYVAGAPPDSGSLNSFQCPANACEPGGRCERIAGDYICECDEGFAGSGTQQCTNIDDCPVPSPCFPGGLCVDGLNDYSCQCGTGYSGSGSRTCVNIDDCAPPNACSPGGVCVDGRESYSCKCDGEVPERAPPNSCRITNRPGEYFDAKTGLRWAGFGVVHIGGTDSPQAYCARTSGGLRRVPTVAEVETVIDLELFNVGNACIATTTREVCGTKQTSDPERGYVWCVR